MKIQASIMTLALFVTLALSISCGGQKGDKTGKEYTSAYICPMHCEGSGAEEPGTCPVCGMDYVKNENHFKDNHEHDHSHGDHDHSH